MDVSNGGLLSKAQYVVSSICGIMLWASRLSFPMQTPKEFPPHQYLQLGLKALIYPEKETTHNLNHHSCIIHSYMILTLPPSPLPSPSSSSSYSSSSLFESMTHSSSWSSLMGDVIGTESGIYTTSNDDILTGGSEKIEPYKCSGSKRNQRCEMNKKEYPPPIPLLARTGNLPGHMPWVLTRHYIDGKLILKEQRVKRHEYFEARRVEGRLILNLISLDDTIRCCHTACDQKNENQPEIENLHFIEEENESEEDVEAEEYDDGYNDNVKNCERDIDFSGAREDEGNGKLDKVADGAPVQQRSMAMVAFSMPKSCRENGIERNGEFPKCLTYAGMTSDSNFFGMPIAMNRTART